MLTFRRGLCVVGCLALALASGEAAVAGTTDAPWLSSESLGRHCLALEEASSPDDGTVCIAYVQGVIAGTRMARDQQPGPAASGSEDESFTDRAIRTRAGTYLRRIDDSQRRDYCIAGDVPASAVLDALTERLAATPDDSNLTAHDIVHEALVQRFPCAER